MPGKLNLASIHKPDRIRAIDWLRGLSVIFMIECHAMIFLAPANLNAPVYFWLQNINGLVSTAFLFAAGFAGGLVGSRDAGDASARRRRARRTLLRLGQVLVVSLYFHYVCAPIFTQPATLLQVDILLCIAIGVAIVWGIVALGQGRRTLTAIALLTLAGGVMVMTPWAWRFRGSLIATELLNGSTGSMFPLFPWLVYPLMGAAMGVIAAQPTVGRRRLIGSLVILLLISGALCLPAMEPWLWNRLPNEIGVFWLRNAQERIWKLCLLLLILLAMDGFGQSTRFEWTRWLTPLTASAEFFSRHALMAYLVHLSLLFGFLNMQFTRQWHYQSNWPQYTWRVLTVILGTAVVCQLIQFTQMGLKRMIHALKPKPAKENLPAGGISE